MMVVACKEDGCHYEEGGPKAKTKVAFAKRLLGILGVEPERLEMFFNVYIEGRDFVEEAEGMYKLAKKLGPLSREMI